MPSSLACWQCGSQLHFCRDCPHWQSADAELDAEVATLDAELATLYAELATLDAKPALLDAEEATLDAKVVSGGPASWDFDVPHFDLAAGDVSDLASSRSDDASFLADFSVGDSVGDPAAASCSEGVSVGGTVGMTVGGTVGGSEGGSESGVADSVMAVRFSVGDSVGDQLLRGAQLLQEVAFVTAQLPESTAGDSAADSVGYAAVPVLEGPVHAHLDAFVPTKESFPKHTDTHTKKKAGSFKPAAGGRVAHRSRRPSRPCRSPEQEAESLAGAGGRPHQRLRPPRGRGQHGPTQPLLISSPGTPVLRFRVGVPDGCPELVVSDSDVHGVFSMYGQLEYVTIHSDGHSGTVRFRQVFEAAIAQHFLHGQAMQGLSDFRLHVQYDDVGAVGASDACRGLRGLPAGASGALCPPAAAGA